MHPITSLLMFRYGVETAMTCYGYKRDMDLCIQKFKYQIRYNMDTLLILKYSSYTGNHFFHEQIDLSHSATSRKQCWLLKIRLKCVAYQISPHLTKFSLFQRIHWNALTTVWGKKALQATSEKAQVFQGTIRNSLYNTSWITNICTLCKELFMTISPNQKNGRSTTLKSATDFNIYKGFLITSSM